MKARFISSIEQVGIDKWNAIAGIDYPFLRYEFLHALEASGSVGAQSGWQPQHLLVENADELMAILPLYIKMHSFGEYVFDHAWAQAYERHGLDYYPKLLSAIPFTPATGSRLAHNVTDEAELIKIVSDALIKQCESINASSWHCLFPSEKELPAWQLSGADLRIGCQYHWFNNGYASMDDFLHEFTSRKRKVVKRERARVVEQGVTLKRLTGNQITIEHWQQFYHFYQLTYAKYSGHGGYLRPEFFVQIHETMRDQLLLVMAYEGDTAIAGALNFFSSDTLYGRYWGSIKEFDCLHFEACYYQGIEFCIERGLKKFDPGAQGEHKIARGFVPTITHSFHWVAHPEFRQAIQHFLVEESKAIHAYQAQAMQGLPFK
jgi:hypothetical protein